MTAAIRRRAKRTTSEMSSQRVPSPITVLKEERKKQTKDPASFATALSAILSSSLKAHSRSVFCPLAFLIPGSYLSAFQVPNSLLGIS